MNEEKKNPEIPTVLGNEINGPGKSYFENVVIDNMLDALLELSAAVWTYHDRVNVLEKVLEKKGVEVGDEIGVYNLFSASGDPADVSDVPRQRS